MIENYEKEVIKVKTYPRNSDLMSEEFLTIFQNLIDKKDAIIELRSNSYKYSTLGALNYKISEKFHSPKKLKK